MMRQGSRSGHRGASAAVLLIGGGAIAAAAWIGGHPGVAAVVIGAYVVLAAIAFAWSGGRGDVAAIMRGGGDERQVDRPACYGRGKHRDGDLRSGRRDREHRADRRRPRPVGVVCMVFGISYGVALAVLRWRT